MDSPVQNPGNGSTTPSVASDEAEDEPPSFIDSMTPPTGFSSYSTRYRCDEAEETPLSLPGPMISEKPSTNTIIASSPEYEDRTTSTSPRQEDVTPHIAFSDVQPMQTPNRVEAPPMPARGRGSNESFTSFLKSGFSGHSSSSFLSRRSGSPSPPLLGKVKRKLSFSFSFSTKSKASTRNPSTTTSLAGSPEIQPMIKEETALDFTAVNRELERINRRHDKSSACTQHGCPKTAHDCKKLLAEAMQARSVDKTEMCRAKCLLIIHSGMADVETKVYAYNILSTQASVGQASHFLVESEKLVREHKAVNPELEKLVGVIEVLRQGAEERKTELGGKARVTE